MCVCVSERYGTHDDHPNDPRLFHNASDHHRRTFGLGITGYPVCNMSVATSGVFSLAVRDNNVCACAGLQSFVLQHAVISMRPE